MHHRSGTMQKQCLSQKYYATTDYFYNYKCQIHVIQQLCPKYSQCVATQKSAPDTILFSLLQTQQVCPQNNQFIPHEKSLYLNTTCMHDINTRNKLGGMYIDSNNDMLTFCLNVQKFWIPAIIPSIYFRLP